MEKWIDEPVDEMVQHIRNLKQESEEFDRLLTTRSKQMKFRLNEIEYDELRELIAESGLTQQEYLYRAAFGMDVKIITGIEELVPELKRQGNNLNQIAKKMNTFGYASADEVGEAVKELKEVWQLLKQLIQEIR